jgi:hypothetical protein
MKPDLDCSQASILARRAATDKSISRSVKARFEIYRT